MLASLIKTWCFLAVLDLVEEASDNNQSILRK